MENDPTKRKKSNSKKSKDWKELLINKLKNIATILKIIIKVDKEDKEYDIDELPVLKKKERCEFECKKCNEIYEKSIRTIIENNTICTKNCNKKIVIKKEKEECDEPNCEEDAKYGFINEETGWLEKKHCKKHIIKGEKSNYPPWKNNYNIFTKMLLHINYKLITNEKEWEIGTNENGKEFKPIMICKEGHEVNNTSIDSFANTGSRCITCVGQLPWSNRYNEFKSKCEESEYKLITTEEEWHIGTKENGCDFKPIMICKEGHEVNNTSIDSFANRGRRCPTCSMFKSEKIVGEILKEFFYNLRFIKRRPDFLKNSKTNSNLELDYYCKSIQLAFEYNGIQHYEYKPYFHRNGICDFENQQYRDKLKIEECKKNNITLITIPHIYDYNNEDKMKEFMIKEIERTTKYRFISGFILHNKTPLVCVNILDLINYEINKSFRILLNNNIFYTKINQSNQ